MGKTIESLGFKATVTADKIKIELPIKGLVGGFDDNPENFNEAKIKRSHYKKFAEYVAVMLIDGSDPDTGNNPLMSAIDRVFEEILEGAEDFVEYREDF